MLFISFWCVISCYVVIIDRVILFRFFFFKQKTAYDMRISDWSSDVCSSDLAARHRSQDRRGGAEDRAEGRQGIPVREVRRFRCPARRRLGGDRKSVV